MKVMVDTNILLDFIQKRQPFFNSASMIFALISEKKIVEFLPVHSITTLDYLIRKYSKELNSAEIISDLLNIFEVESLDKSKIQSAVKLNFNDFEDAVVSILAETSNSDFIVTRNLLDFQNSKVPAITPDLFLTTFNN